MNKNKEVKMTNNRKIFRMEINAYTIMCTLITLAMVALLLYTVAFLPAFGDPNAPTNNEVPQRYVEQGTKETGVINTVAGMILNYRGFDTFGEATILFVAVEGVVSLLRKKYNEELQEEDGSESIK